MCDAESGHVRAVELIDGEFCNWIDDGRFDAFIQEESKFEDSYENLANYHNVFSTTDYEKYETLSEAFIDAYPLPKGITIDLPERFNNLARADEFVKEQSLLGISNLGYNYELLLEAVQQNFLQEKFNDFTN